MRVIELHKSVTESNDRDAEQLRQELREEGSLLVNLMSSPGSGKTSLLSRTVADMRDSRIGILEADIASDVDAVRMEQMGAASIQAHTDGMCHMDAGMTRRSLEALRERMAEEGRIRAEDLGESAEGKTEGEPGVALPELIFLENVGNLICPAEFDTGAGANVMILSVPEGDDKPLKYPLMFSTVDALVITKMDTLPYFDFDLARCEERVRDLNPKIKIFPLSAKSGEGMEAWESWLREQVAAWKLR